MKKTLSLLLAIVMMLSVLVIPAAAASYRDCPKCGTSATVTQIIKDRYAETYSVVACSEVSGIQSHTHTKYSDQYIINCTYCGTVTEKVFSRNECNSPN